MSGLSEQDQGLLGRVGTALKQDTISIVIETGVWALYAATFSFAVYIQFSKDLRHKGAAFLLATTVILFGSSTVLWALGLTQLMQSVQNMVITNTKGPIMEGVMKNNDVLISKSTAMEALFLSNMLIGDSVVIWRAWVLNEGRKIVFVPIVFILAALGFSITAVICLEAEGFTTHSSVPVGSRVCTWSEPIAWGLSLSTNVVATSLIAWIVWTHRKARRQRDGAYPPRSRAERVIVLLVESGFIYSFFLLSQLVLFFGVPRSEPEFYAFAILAPLGDQISGLYPTLIIVLVKMQHSLWNSTQYTGYSSSVELGSRSPPTSGGGGSRIQFRVPVTSHSMDSEHDDKDKPAVPALSRTMKDASASRTIF